MAKVQLVGSSANSHQSLKKKTSQSKRISSMKLGSMNKHKRRATKPYRGQGK